jgi:hypothetical protein
LLRALLWCANGNVSEKIDEIATAFHRATGLTLGAVGAAYPP